eukprot:1701173-Amphidinium_carterae.1
MPGFTDAEVILLAGNVCELSLKSVRFCKDHGLTKGRMPAVRRGWQSPLQVLFVLPGSLSNLEGNWYALEPTLDPLGWPKRRACKMQPGKG